MPEITLLPEGRVIPYDKPVRLMDILLDAGVSVDNPCNGNGICGKCRVRVEDGDVSEAHATEQKLLGGFRELRPVFLC